MRITRQAIRPAELHWRGHTPVSSDYGDVYFSAEQGLAESRYVFIEGSQLPQRCAALQAGQHLTIGELGFGTGLNLLLAAQCFLDHAPADSQLQCHSVDLHPLLRADLQRALAHWPPLQPLSQALLANYPPPINGHHRVRVHPRVEFILMWGPADLCWQDSDASVDVWFLDGFAPACNPQMWTAHLCQTLAQRSAPGATLASFSVASQVRQHLTEAGFEVTRVAGFGRKRHALQGHKPGAPPVRRRRCGQALVLGAGVAGATTARALADRGWRVRVLEASAVAAGGSGNHLGVIYSTPSPHLHAQNRFYQNALWHALRSLHQQHFQTEQLNDVVLHLVEPRRRRNTLEAAATGAWPESQLVIACDQQSARLIGAGYIQPQRWCEHLLDHPNIDVIIDRASHYVCAAEGVTVHSHSGASETADALVVCNAADALQLPALAALPLRAMRGQVSYCRPTADSQGWTQAACHHGYLTPAVAGLHCVGATFDLHGEHTGCHAEDDVRNLAQLRQGLPEAWQALGGDAIEVLGQRAAYRCQSPDTLPLVGPMPDQPGVYLNLAHGSRGLTHTPWCAELLADLLGGLGCAGERELREALAPARYLQASSVHCSA